MVSSDSNSDANYFSGRELNKSAAGWILVAGLGVSAVISGDFAGWNFGIGLGGWGGMLIAMLLMGLMYTCLTLCIAELSAAMPTAGGFYSYVRRAFGQYPGYCAGLAVVFATTIGLAAVANFIEAYFSSLTGVGGWQVKLAFFACFVGIHIWGVGEALKLMLGVTLIAIVALLLFVFMMVPHFQVSNLVDIPVTEAVGANKWLPFGYAGIWQCIPFSIWLFLGIEYTALAAEETRDPARNIPRGMIAAILMLLVLGLSVLIVAPGSGGAAAVAVAGDPLLHVMESTGASSLSGSVSTLFGFMALCGLIASFFSVIYFCSRQIFSLSRAGYLPAFLSVTGARKTPTFALLVPGITGFFLSLGSAEKLVLMAVFLLTLTYILVLTSHIKLRIKNSEMNRPYRTPGGVVTSGLALILAVSASTACYLVEPSMISSLLLIYAVFAMYYLLHGRNNIVSSAPEELFDAVG